MNVYEKLQKARIELQSSSMKKSGHNKFAGYQYFELGDFLPEINNIFAKLGLFSAVSFGKDMAELKVINIEKPDEIITFTSPMAEANLKGCHPIQNLGAVETYNRRYLYVTALEIVEHDALDSAPPVDSTSKKPEPKKPAAGTRDKETLTFILESCEDLSSMQAEWTKMTPDERLLVNDVKDKLKGTLK